MAMLGISIVSLKHQLHRTPRSSSTQVLGSRASSCSNPTTFGWPIFPSRSCTPVITLNKNTNPNRPHGYGLIPIDTFLVGWTSIYQLFWGSLGTRVLTHPHIKKSNTFYQGVLVPGPCTQTKVWSLEQTWSVGILCHKRAFQLGMVFLVIHPFFYATKI